MIEIAPFCCNRRGARNYMAVREALSQGLKSGRETRKGHPQFGRHLCSEKEERERGGRGGMRERWFDSYD